MTPAVKTARSDLAGLVGESKVAFDPAACAPYAVDGITPGYVVVPPSAEHVAAVLRYASEHGLAVIPSRNCTKLGTGSPPRRYDVALSLKELNQVWHYEPADLTVSVEPGMKFGDFQNFVGRNKLWLPVDPRGGGRASLGGILATNSTATLRQRYGAPRDMVLGLRIATAEGKIIKTGGRVVKNVAGYDLGKLLVGSYGTLGVIVEANLKLFPLPTERASFALRAGMLGIARDLRRRILRSALEPFRLTLLGANAAALLRGETSLAGGESCEVWLEVGGSSRVLARCTQDLEGLGRAAGATLAQIATAEAAKLWERASDPAAWLKDSYPNLAVIRAAVPIAASEEFLSHAQQAADGDKVGCAGFVQAGVGSVTVCLLEPARSSAFAALLQRLRKSAEDLGGALVVEQCPAELKRGVEVWGKTGNDFEAMRRVKAVWDPQGILSPGRFVGGL